MGTYEQPAPSLIGGYLVVATRVPLTTQLNRALSTRVAMDRGERSRPTALNQLAADRLFMHYRADRGGPRTAAGSPEQVELTDDGVGPQLPAI